MPKNRRYLLDLKEHWYKSDTRIYRVKLGPGGAHAKLIYGFLASTPEHFDPSEQKISQALDIAPNTVRKALELLVVNNILKRSKGVPVHGRKPRNIYEFVPYQEWKLTCNIEQELKTMAVNQHDEQATTSSGDVANKLLPRVDSNNRLMPCSGATSPGDASPPHPVMNNKRRNNRTKVKTSFPEEPKKESTTNSNDRATYANSSFGSGSKNTGDISLGASNEKERQGVPLDHSIKPEFHQDKDFQEELEKMKG